MSVYFDYLSGSPIDPRVIDVMIPILKGTYGNPLSLHRIGREAASILEQSREQVATFIGASPEEIIFTSGGVESNNLAVKGMLTVHEYGQLLASAVEPMSVLQSAQALESWGFSTTMIPVDANGQLNLLSLDKLLNKFVRLASVAWVVAETGTVQPIEEVAEQVKASGVPFHCDATLAARLFPIDVHELNIDALTICASTIGGPPGVGALFLRHGVRIRPVIDGGAQEMGRRAGRENLAGIAGFARATELALSERQIRFSKLRELDRCLKSRLSEIPDLIFNVNLPSRAPGILSCRIEGMESEALLMQLDEAGIFASPASPCSAAVRKASHVLKAMGLSDEQAASTLNFSLSWETEMQEIDELIEVLKSAVERLRAMSF